LLIFFYSTSTCVWGCWEGHTRAADELKESLLRWNLPDDKLVPVTSDNPRNIVNSIESVNWLHFGCFFHTLQLGVKRVMPVAQVSKELGYGRNLVSHFHHSNKSIYFFKTKRFAF